jgi:hypothetical protein
MKLNWKRQINEKKFNFELSYLISVKINHEEAKLPQIYLEKDYLQDDLKSVVEEYILDKIVKKEEVKKQSLNLDEKSRVRNHFRNVCFRKKFNTMKEHIKYIATYYNLPEVSVYNYIEDDIPFIRNQVGLK